MAQRNGRLAIRADTDFVGRSLLLIRGERVLLDSTIASLYGVTVSQLNQAVRRNRERFPPDFLLELTWRETRFLRSQTVILETSSRPPPRDPRGGHAKYRSLAFTEQGVAMLSGVLRTRRAVRVNIEIMRAFVRLRQVLVAHPELARRVSALEKKVDKKFQVAFVAIRSLLSSHSDSTRRMIGFRTGREDGGSKGAHARRPRSPGSSRSG